MMPKPIMPPPVQALIAGALIWLLAEFVPGLTIAFSGHQVIAYALISIGLCLDLASAAAFVKSKTTINPMAPERSNALVISGFYKFSRNPMYLGLVLILLGWALWLGKVAGFIPVAMFIFTITQFQIKPEEDALEAIFRDQYRDYKRRVRRWI
ncbi:MAG: isoprenylcysteine carboxylmethyltransferase family protein [Pseudomonadota bacterium]